jgi:acyl-CoA hydrolase
VRDGGTLQVGIGELGDALVYALLLRQGQNAAYRAALERLQPAGPAREDAGLGGGAAEPGEIGGREPFRAGLFASTEMFVDQMLDLIRAGVLTRRAYDDLERQRAADAGAAVPGGCVLHAGFFLGPRRFYAALRELPEEERALLGMRGVGYINQLFGPDHELRVLQRRHARFVNTTMMVTLLGAAVSDGLEDGRVVSGVGGQYNFVSMAHALPGGRSILCLRSTRERRGRLTSNILWSYGHATIQRHLRDVVVTEYGVADLRGRTDEETVAALLAVADSRFQEGLLAQAKAAGKIRADHRIPEAFRDNTPGRLERCFAEHRRAGRFEEYPFGTDLTPEEIALSKALEHLRDGTAHLPGRLRTAAAALRRGRATERQSACLRRLRLDPPRTLRERLLRRLVLAALEATGT